MKTLNTTDIQFVSGGITVREFRDGVRVATPIGGAVCGLLITYIFDLNKFTPRLVGAVIGGIVTHFVTELSIGDEALRNFPKKEG